MRDNYKFSISIPTYNRRELLERNLDHLEAMDFEFDQFEVIVVDDGSTDETEQFMIERMEQSSLNMRYIKKKNGGKYTAVNEAIDLAKGFFFINCDSDDYLPSNCLRKIIELWSFSTDEQKQKLAGIIGQNLNVATNKVSGDKFPDDLLISDPIEMRFKFKIKGDKFPCFRTDVIKQFKFPEPRPGLKFIPESYLFYGISKDYNFLYSNEVLQHCEYQKSGLTNKIQEYRLANSYGCFIVYEKYIKLFSPKKSFLGYTRNYMNYVRFAFHIKERPKMRHILDFFLLIGGLLLFLLDGAKRIFK